MNKTSVVLFWEGYRLYVDILVFVPIQTEGGELREEDEGGAEAA